MVGITRRDDRHRAWRTAAQGLLLSAVLILGSLTTAQPAGKVHLGLRLHVAEQSDSPVVDEAFISSRVTRANEIFAPYGVSFEVSSRAPLAARHALQVSREDRDALAEYGAPGAIDVFIVAALRDVDEPGPDDQPHWRRGVHWHAGPRSRFVGRHYVILSSIAGLSVLAHELGHFLGNPEHSHVPGNLMSYEHTDVLPFLDRSQVARLRRALTRYLRSGELRALTSP
ncbi:MAG: hypothetical protein ABW321_02605 [Polyangiales bacterium]